MKQIALPLFIFLFLCACSTVQADEQAKPVFGQGIMVGEVTDTSAIVQVRVTQGTKLIDGDTYDDGDAMKDGDLPGVEAEVVFGVKHVRDALRNNPVARVKAKATLENDFIARLVLENLEPGNTYRVEAFFPGENAGLVEPIATAQFKTHPGKDTSAPVRFVMSSCMNYDKFTGSDGSNRSKGYQGEDRALGYPAAEAVLKQKPDFMFFAGDVV